MSELALRYLESLSRSQWLSPGDLARCQSPLMERLCRHAARETEFYRDRLGVLFANGDLEVGAFRPDRWHEVPVFGRAEAQRAGPVLFARAVPPEVGGTRIGQTSGSTGRPLQFRLSVFLDIASAAALARCLQSHELDLSGSLGYIKSDVENDCPAPLGNEGQNWNCVDPQARWCTLAASATIDQCVAWLRLRRPDYLMSYPSIVSAIMKELARGGEPIRLKAVISLGENVADGFAAAVRDRFGARHIDVYGAQEVGTFAHQCATGPHLHVAAEMALVEILDDGGAPARPGQTGRIVATSFYSYAMPMIRYDIGDFAVPGEACACGRGLPTIARIVGRTRNVFRFADGTARWPRGLNVLTRYIDFVQIRVVQRDLARVEVHYVPGDDPGRNDEAGAARFLRDILHPDIAVEFVPLAEIPRGPSGKFEDFVSMVGDG